jgi:hypothetical protein
MALGFDAPMNESCQNGQPVILWISMPPGASDRGDNPVDPPPTGGPSHYPAPPRSTGPATRPSRLPGLFIPYTVLEVIAIMVGGGVIGLLIALRWPQAGALLGTVSAIIGTVLAILDIMKKRDGNGSSGPDRA